MRLLPQGAWFGLTWRRIRVVLFLVAGCVLMAFAAFLALRIYLWRETRVAAKFFEKIESVPIGVPAEPYLRQFRRYEDVRYEREIKYPTTSQLLRIDPWRAYHPYTRFDRVDSFIREMLYDSGADVRRKLGLRVWIVGGAIHTKDGKISSVEAGVTVEGKSEWLMGNWVLLPELDGERLRDYRVDLGQHPEMAHYFSHWSHLHMGLDTGEVINNSLSSDADAEQMRAGRQFDFSCFSGGKGCNSLCDLMPLATRYRHAHSYPRLGWNSGSWAPQDQSCE